MIAVLAVLAMALTMFLTGLRLRGRDFLRVASMPGLVLSGLALQLGLMPLAALAAGHMLAGAGGAGLALALLAPGPIGTHPLVGLAGGHVGLARTLTAWGAVLFVPVILLLGVPDMLPGFAAAILPFCLLPLLAGLVLPQVAPLLAARIERILPWSAGLLTLFVAIPALWGGIGNGAALALGLVLAGTAVLAGGGLGRLAGAGRGRTLALSGLLRNPAVPLGLTLTSDAAGAAAAAVSYACAAGLVAFGLLWLMARARTP